MSPASWAASLAVECFSQQLPRKNLVKQLFKGGGQFAGPLKTFFSFHLSRKKNKVVYFLRCSCDKNKRSVEVACCTLRKVNVYFRKQCAFVPFDCAGTTPLGLSLGFPT